MAKSKITKDQIEAWKKEFGTLYLLQSENGLEGYIKDPTSNIRIMKLAVSCLSKSREEYVNAILTNCFLGGDDEIKEEQYANGLADQLDEITDIPNCKTVREGNKFVMVCEGLSLSVRMANRADINLSEKKNGAREPFVTAENLLKIIALDKEELATAQKNTRAWLGFLTATDEVKNKVAVNVTKL